jgi:hypothetical protein
VFDVRRARGGGEQNKLRYLSCECKTVYYQHNADAVEAVAADDNFNAADRYQEVLVFLVLCTVDLRVRG